MKLPSWHFFIPLDSALPVEDNYISVKHPSGYVEKDGDISEPRPDGVFFIFHQELVEAHPFPRLDAAMKSLEKRRIGTSEGGDIVNISHLAITVAEVVVSKYYKNGTEEKDTPDHLSDAFDFALEQLNTWIKALALISDSSIPLVRRESLPSQLVVAAGAYAPWELEYTKIPRVRPDNILLLNWNMPTLGSFPEPIPDLDDWMGAALASVDVPGPLIASANIRKEADHYYHRVGNYQISAILYASSCESFFDELLQHLLWEEGLRPENSAPKFLSNGRGGKGYAQPKSITSLVKKELLPKLVGNLLEGKVPEEIELWIEKISTLRNRVIHSSYQPTASEMKDCCSAYSTLMDFISDRLFAVREKYRYTALSFLGEKGLTRRGVWEEFRDMESNLPSVYKRYRAFRRWSDHVSAFREIPDIFGSLAKSDEARMFLVVRRSGDRRAFAVHSSGTVATELSIDSLQESEAYCRLSSHDVNKLNMDPTVLVSNDTSGFDIPEGTHWDLYSYDVVPGPQCMFENYVND